MFIKWKTRIGIAYIYGMLLSSKMSVLYKKKLNSRRMTVSVVKRLSLDITRYIAGHFPISVVIK